MGHALIFSRYQRNGRDEVLVLDAGDRQAHLHPGMNAVPADLWAAAREGEQAQQLLQTKAIEERGIAEDPPAEPPPAAAGTPPGKAKA